MEVKHHGHTHWSLQFPKLLVLPVMLMSTTEERYMVELYINEMDDSKWLSIREENINRMNKKIPTCHRTWLPTAESWTKRYSGCSPNTTPKITEVGPPYISFLTPSLSSQHSAKHKLHGGWHCLDEFLRVHLHKQASSECWVYKRVIPPHYLMLSRL